MAADTPGDRTQLLVRRIVESRQEDDPIRFEAEDVAVEYEDSTLRIETDRADRDALNSLLEEYRVCKIKQPETRKAVGNVVYLSMVTDAKHTADCIEALFRQVYAFGEEYELRTVDST